MNAFAYLVTVALCLTVGWAAGVYTSPRVNTAAAHAYARALDIEARAKFNEQRVALEATCAAEKRVAQQKADTDAAWYSAEIVGLRTQLKGRGIQEQIVPTETR